MRTQLLAFLIVLSTNASALAAEKKPAPVKAPQATRNAAPAAVASKSNQLPSAITAALRMGYNKPGSDLSAGWVPDIEAGYRFGFGKWGLEPAIGWQRWGGKAEGTVTSPLISLAKPYRQDARAQVVEGRMRAWYLTGSAGAAVLGLGVGAAQIEAEQKSFGQTRTESTGKLTFAVHGGWDFPIAAAYGNIEVMLGYRQAQSSLVTTGDANLSGLQALLGWHAAF